MADEWFVSYHQDGMGGRWLGTVFNGNSRVGTVKARTRWGVVRKARRLRKAKAGNAGKRDRDLARIRESRGKREL